MHLICGTFHSNIACTWKTSGAPSHRRIYSKHPNKFKDESYLRIGVDEQHVFDGQSYHDRIVFVSRLGRHHNIITLTRKEKELIINSGVFKIRKLICFEEIHPFFREVKFISDAHKNYSFLVSALNYISQLKFEGFTTNYWSRKYLHKVARKIGHISTLDLAFFHVSNVPYQESFKLSEARPDRCIIALDFNSMYGSCMTGDFPDPAKLAYSDINKIYSPSEPLACGLYRVLLSYPKTEFIKKYHALKYALLNKRYTFSLKDDSQVEVLLHSNEVHFYAKHFAEIYIYEGVNSAESRYHPLIKDVQRIYKQRIHYKKQGNLTLERLCKLELATMHSAVKRKKFSTIIFHNALEACHFFEVNYGITRPKDMHMSEFFSSLSDGVRFTIKIDDKINITYISFSDNSLVHSLFSQVIANSRIKMMQTIEYMEAFSGLEVCYCNIDSLHISIPNERTEEFHRYVAPLVGTELGKLKIETEAEQGYWFEPGRYWLISNRKVVLFKNQGLNKHYNNEPFQDSISYYKTYEEDGFTMPVKCRRDIVSVLTYKKKLSNISDASNLLYERYGIDEILTVSKSQESIDSEIKNSSVMKLDLFYDLAENFSC